MIIRQDSCGTWTVTSGQVLQYGSTQELEIVLQDKDGRNLDPSQHGDIWALSLWTPSASDPVQLANCYLGVDSVHLSGELPLSSEALYLYCAERFRSIVVLNLRSVPDPDVDAAFELDTRALVQWQGDNHRVGPKPPCPPAPPPTPEDIATRIASAMADHNADASAHPGITNGFQPLIDQAHPLPALYVSGLDPVATSGSYAQLKNVPERFTPTAHTHSVEDITDLSIGWDEVADKPSEFPPEQHTHTVSDISDMPEPFSGSYEDLTDVPETFTPSTHTHTKSQITDLSLAWGDITGKPETFTPSSHTHTKSQITDLSLGWNDITGKPETFTPSTHTHTKSQITDLSLAWGDITGKPEAFTPAAHTHTTADVSQPVTSIPAATAEYTLADGGVYIHAPSASPIYTLPAVSDNTVAHEIVVDVKFSAAALSVAFQTTASVLVPITPDFDSAAGDVYRFLCAWTSLYGWTVKAVPLELA